MTDANRTKKQEPLVVSQDECAEQLRISRRTVERMVAEGQLPSLKLRRRRVIPAEFLRDLVRGA